MKGRKWFWLAGLWAAIVLGSLLWLGATVAWVQAAPSQQPPAALIAGAQPAAATPAGAITYVVRRGDTLSAIGRRFGVSVAALMRANHIVNPDRIYAGQRLLIPVGPAPTSTPRPVPVTPCPCEAITIVQPAPGITITSPVTVTGMGSGFEQNLGVRILDATGFEIGSGNAMISGELGARGPYTGVVTFTMPISAQPGRIQVFSASPRDGAFEHLTSVSVQLPGNGLDAALEQLKAALEKPDLAAARQLLGRSFLLGLYRSDSFQSDDPAQTITLLQAYGLGQAPILVDFSVDGRKLLEQNGSQPPSGVEHVAFSRGWGEDGAWLAFLFMGVQQGQMRWVGALLVSPEARDF